MKIPVNIVLKDILKNTLHYRIIYLVFGCRMLITGLIFFKLVVERKMIFYNSF